MIYKINLPRPLFKEGIIYIHFHQVFYITLSTLFSGIGTQYDRGSCSQFQITNELIKLFEEFELLKKIGLSVAGISYTVELSNNVVDGTIMGK